MKELYLRNLFPSTTMVTVKQKMSLLCIFPQSFVFHRVITVLALPVVKPQDILKAENKSHHEEADYYSHQDIAYDDKSISHYIFFIL